jgi:hypothetical protein
MPSSILQLKISFPNSYPLIWRSVVVEAASSFIDLHETIQVIMNWTDEKGFFFLVADAQVADPDDYEGSAADDIIDAYETELADLLLDGQKTFLYRYFDENSDWRLEIEVEDILNKSPNKNYPYCLDGAMQAPLEDCADIQEYQQLLEDYDSELLHKKEHARDLLGLDYDPAAFSIEEVNDELLSFVELEFPIAHLDDSTLLDGQDALLLDQILQPSHLETFQLQLESARQQFQQYKEMGEKAMAQVPDKGLFWQFSDDSNSIAILVKHLWGNMLSRWTDFLDSDGEKDWRERDQEFENDINSRKELLDKWEEGWLCLFRAMDELEVKDWTADVMIRKEPHQVWQAVNRQIAHYAYHIGQLVFLAKMLADRPWETLSIAKGKSKEFNEKKMG